MVAITDMFMPRPDIYIIDIFPTKACTITVISTRLCTRNSPSTACCHE